MGNNRRVNNYLPPDKLSRSLQHQARDLLVTALQNPVSTWRDNFEIHLIGHSAGAIFLDHLPNLVAALRFQDYTESLHLQD